MWYKGQMNVLIGNSIPDTKIRFLQHNVPFRHGPYSQFTSQKHWIGGTELYTLGKIFIKIKTKYTRPKCIFPRDLIEETPASRAQWRSLAFLQWEINISHLSAMTWKSMSEHWKSSPLNSPQLKIKFKPTEIQFPWRTKVIMGFSPRQHPTVLVVVSSA